MPTMRVDDETLALFREFAEKNGLTLCETASRAAKTLQRERFLDEADAAYKRLREDPEEWEAELDERRFWDAVVGDRPEPQ